MPGANLERILPLWVLFGGCIESPAPPERTERPVVTFSPARDDRPWPETRISVRTADASRLDPGAILLFAGELSEQKLAHLDDEELPKTLAEQSRPLVSWWNDALREAFVQPAGPLVPGTYYTLAAPAYGRLSSFSVLDEPERPVLTRLWPPEDHPAGGQVVICGELLPEAQALVLEPGGASAHFEPNFGHGEGLSCGRVRFDSAPLDGRVVVLPPELGGYLVRSQPLSLGVRDQPLAFPQCTAEEFELGPGCARAEDDRLIVRNADQPLLWRFETSTAADSAWLAAADANAELVMRGLTPNTEIVIAGTVIASDGAEAAFGATVRTTAPRTRLVLNEVLANPLGPEPAGEWIELFNAGRQIVDVAGMQLRDSAGSVELPSARIEPGAFALVVRDDFVPGPSDVVPVAAAQRILVPILAKNGLSNAGEALALLDSAGNLVSRFPAIAAPHAGVSIARAGPDALDADASAFAEHAQPGASPGAPNTVVRKPSGP